MNYAPPNNKELQKVTDNNHDYEMGLRDGKIKSLEKAVEQIATDLAKFKIAIYMLYGAIALMQFMPTLRGFFSNAISQ